MVIVGHDASGPTAVNWVRRNLERTEHLVLLNCFYHPTRSLGRFVGLSPTRLGFGVRLLREMVAWRFVPTAGQLGWIEQFAQSPSTTQAFRGWTGDLHRSLRSNAGRAGSLTAVDRPVTVAFGRYDPYRTPATATEIAVLFPTSSLQLIEAGHWPQLELPEQVAAIVRRATRDAEGPGRVGS